MKSIFSQKNLKRLAIGLFAAAIIAPSFTFAAPVAPPANPAAARPAANAAPEAPRMTVAEAAEIAKTSNYKHTSQRYGYSINCPKKPNVIPLSVIDEKSKGEVLIFDNDGYYMKNAWIIKCDAFEDKEFPPNIATMKEDEQQKFIERVMNSSGYEFVRIADLGFTHGVYCVTGKEVEIDEDGDGKPDVTMKADTQEIITFLRGQFGGRFAIELIDNPELTEVGISAYHVGMMTFQEWPTSGAAEEKSAKDDKKKKK